MSLRIRVILPIIIILFAIFLRFYRFTEFVTFLGDQGRDAIIIKRIITFEHFPAIGAPSSLGQIFLGPFYYYLIAPFLFLFNFNPVGLAFGVSFLMLVGIIFIYYLLTKEEGYLTPLVFLTMALFSIVNIQASRFSWNPNLLPVFSFLTLYFFYKNLTKKNKLFPILFGSFLSFSIQLHHLALLLLFPITLVYIYHLSKTKKQLAIQQYNNITISVLSVLFFSLPLIIFDLRHNFLNSKSFIRLLTEHNPANNQNFISKFLETNSAFYAHIFQVNFNQFLGLALTLFILFFFFKKFDRKKNLFLAINLLSLIVYLVSFSFFSTPRIPHYYNPIYFSFFLTFAWMITHLSKNKFVIAFIVFIIIGFYSFFNLKSLSYFFTTRGNNQIKNAEKIADSILAKKPQIPYQTVALPYVETDGHIRYFLEINGKRPLPSDTLANPKELYVLCFEKDCKILGNAQWQIAAFQNAKIESSWNVAGVKIYKVVHKI